jgi:organic hydroperoxide reductase OsmC/OhrA
MNDKPLTDKLYKTHIFSSSAKWTGNRTWTFNACDAPEMIGGPPPIFGGECGRWTPEDLLIAAVNTCHVSTFISMSLRKCFEFISLESTIEGSLEHNGAGYVFSKMVIRPKVVVKTEADIEMARDLLERAHKSCFMGNSVTASLTMEPEITVAK